MTDYSGLGVASLLEELGGWRDMLAASASSLREAQGRVAECRSRLDDPDAAAAHARHFEDVFTDYVRDLDRIMTEIRHGVRARHISALRYMSDHTESKERACVAFKEDQIERPLRDEGMRSLLDGIYYDSRQPLVDLRDLSNITARLETFLADPGEELPQEDIVDLKPNLAGVGLNVNALIRRVRRWVTERQLPPPGRGA